MFHAMECKENRNGKSRSWYGISEVRPKNDDSLSKDGGRSHWDIILGASGSLKETEKAERKSEKGREDESKSERLECQRCKLSFYGRSRVSNLNKHMGAAHLGKRPFACDECKKKFQFLYQLNRHKATVHRGVRPYECMYCNQRFSDKSNMTKHIRGRSCMREKRKFDNERDRTEESGRR